MSIRSTSATGTICTDAKYKFVVNTFHHSHWYYLFRRQIHHYCQYCPPQPLVLHVQTVLSTTGTGTICTDAQNTSIVKPVQHSHWYYLYRRQIHLCCQYCPPRSQVLLEHTPNTTLLSILSIRATACTDAKYTSVVNTFHHSHSYYLYRSQIHIRCQYFPPQPLVLPVQAPNTPLLSILSTTATGTTYTDVKYTSIVSTIHYSLWYYLYRCKIHLNCQYCPSKPLVLPVLSPNINMLSIPSTTATGTKNTNLLSILSTEASATTCREAKCTSSVSTVHQSHWYYLFRRQILLCCQYSQAQPLALPIQTPHTPLFSILSTTASGTTCTDAKYTSIVNTVHHSHLYYL